MKMNKLISSGVAAGMMVAASAASAAVIDFTAATTGTSGTINGVAWTLSSSAGALNNSQAFDGGVAPANSLGLAFDTDGYGVGDDEISADEIARGESIVITFARAVRVTGFAFLDIFENGNTGSGEAGIATIGAASFSALFTGAAGGYTELGFGPIVTTTVTFTASLINDGFGVADGALAALEVAPIPAPAAGLLLLTALGGVVALRRRKA